MVLHLGLWALRLGELYRFGWDAVFGKIVLRAARHILRMTERTSGRVPNQGPNDGSLVLDLAPHAFGDYRSIVQVAFRSQGCPPPFAAGPWDELSAWLLGPGYQDRHRKAALPSAKSTPLEKPGQSGGDYVLGRDNSWALVRCARYNRRPFQADQLHVDLWWRGTNVAQDAGTYLYNGEPPWDNGLAGTAPHNTVTVDHMDQMWRLGRFLWVDWAQGTVLSFCPTELNAWDYFEGEHDGYRRLGITHRRAVQRLKDFGWLIVDELLGKGEHQASLHWLLTNLPLTIQSQWPWEGHWEGNKGSGALYLYGSIQGRVYLVRGGKASVPPDFPISASLTAVRGWVSPTYGELKSTSSIVLDVCGQLPIRLITAVLFNGSTWIEQSEPDELRLKLGDASHILVTLSRLDSAASGNRIVSKIEVVSPPVNS